MTPAARTPPPAQPADDVARPAVRLPRRHPLAVVAAAAGLGLIVTVLLLLHGPRVAVSLQSLAIGTICVCELLGGLWALAAGRLRSRLTAAVAGREEALRQAAVLGKVARALSSTLDPDEVLSIAVGLAAEIASPPGLRARRANYCRISDGVVHVVAECDAQGEWLGASWPLSEHPHLARTVQTRRPTVGELNELGPTVRGINRSQGVAHGGWLPVCVEGELHGVLAIAGRNRAVSEQDLSRCAAIVEMMQLALTNALTHQRSRTAALTDSLTALLNRRGLAERMRERADRQRYAVLAVDVDGLKEVNDRHGHGAGDELLRLIGDAIDSALRVDDIVARVGGDEFTCVLFEADEAIAAETAARIGDAVANAPHRYLRPSVSIGAAVADPGAPFDTGLRAADAALYRAKHSGGRRHILATPSASDGLRMAEA
jgi:diguanylate cyclase (GGDEF)-like protein